MMKILKKKLLFALASEQDFLKIGANYGYHPYDFLYFRLSEFEPGSVRDAAIRLVREDLVDKLSRNNQAQLRLTGLGRDRLIEVLGLSEPHKGAWDRRWRMVVLNGTGNQHRSLINALRELSYRRVARGVYVTPQTVSAATKKLFLDKNWTNLAQVLESRRLIVGDDLQWARILWDLDTLAQKYEDFVSLADRLLKLSRRNNILLRQSKGGFKQVFDSYFYLINHDPRLPSQLLPPNWPADKAEELFLRLVTLAKTAKI